MSHAYSSERKSTTQTLKIVGVTKIVCHITQESSIGMSFEAEFYLSGVNLT